MIKFTPEQPPAISGDASNDIIALRDYIADFVDELEFIINKGAVEDDSEFAAISEYAESESEFASFSEDTNGGQFVE